jgi:hypothetical protein
MVLGLLKQNTTFTKDSIEIPKVPKRRFLNFMTTYKHKTFVHELYIMAPR